MRSVAQAHLVPGKGIEGDRFYGRSGAAVQERVRYSVTLVEWEAVEAVKRARPESATDASGRRNIVVRDCALPSLAGQLFRIGDVLLRGIAPPDLGCDSPVDVHRTVCASVSGRWLGAEILTEGHVRVGDTLSIVSEQPGERDV
ncbi:MAG: hypothetical protein IMW89_12180 [Ktedonobacteraceae bacterium]|nr:hypothetical protein [Ktedonobacteraceae bacterium]